MESSAELSSEEMDLDLENVGDQNDSKNTKDQKKVEKNVENHFCLIDSL